MWIAVLFITGIVGLYALSFTMNKKTPAPFELKNIDALKCGACRNYGCSIKQDLEEEEA